MFDASVPLIFTSMTNLLYSNCTMHVQIKACGAIKWQMERKKKRVIYWHEFQFGFNSKMVNWEKESEIAKSLLRDYLMEIFFANAKTYKRIFSYGNVAFFGRYFYWFDWHCMAWANESCSRHSRTAKCASLMNLLSIFTRKT